MNSISNKNIDFTAVKNLISLLDYAGRFVELKKKGSEYVGLCPFHDDHNPSFKIYLGDDGVDRYHCFVCGAGSEGGDVIDFCKAINNVDAPEAVRILKGDMSPESDKTHKRPKLPADKSKCWKSVIPVPDDAPPYDPAKTYNPSQGKFISYRPERLDTYRDADGKIICHIVRLNFRDGNKACMTITYCDGPGGTRWAAKRMKGKLPLQGLNDLAKRPDAYVLIVSGEKCKEYGDKHLQGFVTVTLLGGDQCVDKADLTPLQGRRVVLFPDADDSGIQAMLKTGRRLEKLGCKIRYIDTKDLSNGYDLADLVDDGVTGENLKKWCADRVKDGLPVLPPKAQPTTKRNTNSETKANSTSQAENDPNKEKPNSGWPELIPLDSPTLPKLSSTALPGFAGRFVRALSAATETPIELASGLVLATCATAVARRMVADVEPGYIEPCNIWILVALTSGSRKSAIQSATTAPLVTWERDQGASMAPEIKRIVSNRKTMEARAKKKRNKAANATDASKAKEFAKDAADIEVELPEIPQPPQLWTSDSTPERMGSLLFENDECMAWLSSEGGFFEIVGGRYSKGVPNLDVVLKAHSGDPERVDRGSRPPVFLLNPLLTTGLSPQPDVLLGLASKPGFRGRGLLARFLYFLPESKLGYRRLETVPISKTVQKAYADGITAMLNWELDVDSKEHTCRHVVRLSKGAREERLKYAKDIEIEMRPGKSMEHVTDWAGKAPGAAVRIAGVLHGIEHAHDNKPWDHEITAETMSAALEIMAVIAPHSLAALDMMGADSGIAAARHVWKWIERSRLEVFTIREAFNSLKGTFPRVQEIRPALAVLEERGYVEIQPVNRTGEPGRPPSPAVLVRPEIFK